MAVDRQGDADYSHGAAAGWNGETVEWQCGDSISPRTVMSNFNHEVTFDNSSGQNVHHVNITWTWPDYGEGSTYSLFDNACACAEWIRKEIIFQEAK